MFYSGWLGRVNSTFYPPKINFVPLFTQFDGNFSKVSHLTNFVLLFTPLLFFTPS